MINCVISRLGHVRWDIMQTVGVIPTGHLSTPLTRAETLADTTPTADAIITQATVPIGTIRLTVNATVNRASTHRQPVYILMDITISRPCQVIAERATITVSTVLDSLLMDATVS